MAQITDSEILAIEGSVPVEIACKYLGISKCFLYGAMQRGVLSIGCAFQADGGHWCYDIRPEALVEYKHHGSIKKHENFEQYIKEVITNTCSELIGN